MDKFFKYKTYGLNILSEFEISELNNKESETSDIDVIIKFDNIPREIKAKIKNGQTNGYEENIVWIDISNIAKYLIKDGNTIIIEPYDDVDFNKIKLYLLGTCFGIILIQRKTIAIHGAAIDMDGKGIIISGQKGAGKSTLSSKLMMKGAQLVADDVSVITGKEKYNIEYAYDGQKICHDTMKILGYNYSDFEAIDINGEIKYKVKSSRIRTEKPVNLNMIFIFKIDSVDKVMINRLKGIEKFENVFNNIYRLHLILNLGVNNESIKKTMDIVKSTTVYEIIRPKHKFTIDEIVEIIEDKIKEIA